MWGIIVGAAILSLPVLVLVRSLCAVAKEADAQECQELKELLLRRNIREGNSVE